jgi:hypothetical protein
VGGKLAQVGSRLVDGAAAKMADDFFAAFSKHFAQAQSAQGDASETDGAGGADQASTNGEATEPRATDGLGFIWATAFVVLITAMVLAL